MSLYLINKPPYSPIKHEFDSNTGVVTFKLDRGYRFDNILVSQGNLPQPAFDSETTEVKFNAFDLAVGTHDFVSFGVGKTADKYIIEEYEILHQSNSEIIIQLFQNGHDFAGYRHIDTYSY